MAEPSTDKTRQAKPEAPTGALAAAFESVLNTVFQGFAGLTLRGVVSGTELIEYKDRKTGADKKMLKVSITDGKNVFQYMAFDSRGPLPDVPNWSAVQINVDSASSEGDLTTVYGDLVIAG